MKQKLHFDRCMRCNARWIGTGEIYCEECISMSHLEMCHAETMVCNCHEYEPFKHVFKMPKRYKRYILQLRKELKEKQDECDE
jgi:hypothetical protein